MYTYRKPKNSKHLIEILEATGNEVVWDIKNQNIFDMYSPILLIFKENKLVGGAHSIGSLSVINPFDKDITKTFSKTVLADINANLKQIEIF